MSYPTCKHGNNDPNHECEACRLERDLDQLRATLATVTAERDAWLGTQHSLCIEMKGERDAATAEAEALRKERELLREALEAAQADTRRLDWLEKNAHLILWNMGQWTYWNCAENKWLPAPSIRAAIDSTMKPTP